MPPLDSSFFDLGDDSNSQPVLRNTFRHFLKDGVVTYYFESVEWASVHTDRLA